MAVCDYCGGSGRDAVIPSERSCYKCGGLGTLPDPIVDPPLGGGKRGGGGSGGIGIFSDIVASVDDLFDRIPPVAVNILTAFSFVGTFGYALYSGEALGEALIWGFGGIAAWLACFIAINIALKLILICVIVALGVLVAYVMLWIFKEIIDVFS